MSSNAIRVLVVDDDPAITELLRLILIREGFAVSTAASGEIALTQAVSQPPALAILDVKLPGMNGYTVCRRLRQNPSTRAIPILMLTSKSEIGDKIAGFEAGADDYLLKPFEPEEIPYRIKNLLVRAREPEAAQVDAARRGQVIVFFGAKGGVGKTTIAANFTIALRKHTGKAIALFDADFSFGDLGLQLNLPPSRTVLDLVKDIALLDREVVEHVLLSHPSGIRVLLSPLQRERVELITVEHVRRILELLQELHDYVVIDCHSTYDEPTLEILERADHIFLVVTPEVGPLVNAGSFLELAQRLDVDRGKINVILNRANSDVGILPSEVARSLNHPIAFRLVSGGRPVVQSVNRGTPIILAQPTHPFSQQILPMVEYIAKRPSA